jgi:hypothetical protein
MTITATAATAIQVRELDPSPTFNGHPGQRVPAGCTLLSVEDLQVGDVLQHAPGTFDLVPDIQPEPSETTRTVHVLRTVPSGRTASCFFWAGAHARRTVHKVVAVTSE